MADAPGTLRARQLAFAHHVRDPETHPPPPGIEEHRLRVYRELFLASIGGLLAGNFPVIRRTLADADWQALVRAFYTGHRCATPLFTEVAREFVHWLAARDGTAGDPPWLRELAHYEWIELALHLQDPDVPAPVGAAMAASPSRNARGEGDSHELGLSPLARPLAYTWPVHRVGPDYQPAEPPVAPTLLLARRDEAGDVRFSELSPLVFRLLQLLGDDAGTHAPDAVLATLAREAGETGNADFLGAGHAMLQRLLDEGTVIRALC